MMNCFGCLNTMYIGMIFFLEFRMFWKLKQDDRITVPNLFPTYQRGQIGNYWKSIIKD